MKMTCNGINKYGVCCVWLLCGMLPAGGQDEECHDAEAVVPKRGAASLPDDIVVRAVNVTGRAIFLDANGSVDRFIFIPTNGDNREWFRVARPFAPVVGEKTAALQAGRVQWFLYCPDGEICLELAEDAAYEADMDQRDGEHGAGFRAVCVPEGGAMPDGRGPGRDDAGPKAEESQKAPGAGAVSPE